MNEQVICNKEDLTAIADAIREQTGGTETYNVPELSSVAVNAIKSGSGGISVQADWSTNEPENKTYIKNRTHWLEVEKGEIVPATTINFISYNGLPACFSPVPYTAFPSVNTTYKVIWRGQEYECVSHEGTVNDMTVMALGNSAPVFAAFGSNDGIATNDPFAMCFMPESMVPAFNAYTFYVSFDGWEETTVNIFGEKLNYHKIDKNYLPIMNDFLINGNNYAALRSVDSPDNEYQMGSSSVALGCLTQAQGFGSSAFGYKTAAIGDQSLASGDSTTAIGYSSHAEGQGIFYPVNILTTPGERESTITYNDDNTVELSAIEEGSSLLVIFAQHRDNQEWVAISNATIEEIEPYSEYSAKIKTDIPILPYYAADNYIIQEEMPGLLAINGFASSNCSHSEGSHTSAVGYASHSEGMGTIAKGQSQHVQGQYNIKDNNYKYAHIVGNGNNSSARSNAHTLDWEGNAWFAGDVYVGSANGTNYDAGSKKLATEEYVKQYIEEVILGGEW